MGEHCIFVGGIVEELNKWTCLTYQAAARALGVSIWRIRYAVESGYLSAPSVVLKQRAFFSPGQVKEMKAFFEMEEAAKKRAGSNLG